MALLAERLSERFGGTEAFFCNSGAEAVEAALKYARRQGGKSASVALKGSFHGRTLGALAVTGQPAKRKAFEPLPRPVRFARPNDVESLSAAIGPETGLVLLESVLGEGGVVPLEPEFVRAAAAGAFASGDHASTFGGNPVACAAACAVCDAVDDDLLAKVRQRGDELRAGLDGLGAVREVRGSGLLIGAELDRPAPPLVTDCLEHGLLVTSAGDRVLRLTPPLTIERSDVDEALDILREVLT